MAGEFGGWLHLIINFVLVVVLAGGLAYGTWQWHKRSPAAERASEDAARRLYEQEPEDERTFDEPPKHAA